MRYISIILFIVCVSFASQAQSSIDKIIKTLEKDPNVETLYNETRNPKTKKIISSRIIITFDNAGYCDKLKQAFRDERVNSVRCKMSRGLMDLEFENGTRYNFYYDAKKGSKCTLMIRSNTENADDEASLNIMDDGLDVITPDLTTQVATTHGSRITPNLASIVIED